MSRRRLPTVIAVALLTLLAAVPLARAADITGTWALPSGSVGSQTWTFTAGTGTLAGEGSGGCCTWPMAGTISGNSVRIVTDYRELRYTAYFVGTVSGDGRTMSGTWAEGSYADAERPGASRWSATRSGPAPRRDPVQVPDVDDLPGYAPSGAARSIKLLLDGRTSVIASGAYGVQVRTDGTCEADLVATGGNDFFKPAGGAIRRAGTHLIPIDLTRRGRRAVEDARRGGVKVRAKLSCSPTTYASHDLLGRGVGRATPVARPSPDPGKPDAVTVTLLDASEAPGQVPVSEQFRVRWRGTAPGGAKPIVTFDLVDRKVVENFTLTGGLASCIGAGALAPKQADFTQFRDERIRLDALGQAVLSKSLAVPGDQVRRAQLSINFNEASVGKDTAGGVLKFDFRAGEGVCGLLATFTAKPERIEVPPEQMVEYNGRTERKGAVTFNVAQGKRIDDLRIEVPVQCRGSSALFGTLGFETVELFEAGSIRVDDGVFRFRSSGTADLLTVTGRIANGVARGEVVAARTLTTGTSDFISCGSETPLTFTARPGKPERREDRDGDGVADEDDRCKSVSDAGNPRRPRDGCPAGDTSLGAITEADVRRCGRASTSALAWAAEACDDDKIQAKFRSYASVYMDKVVETFLPFVDQVVPRLAPEDQRGELVAYAKDIYAQARIKMRAIVHESVVITQPAQLVQVRDALVGSTDHIGQVTTPLIVAPDCNPFGVQALVAECKNAYRALKQATLDAAIYLADLKRDVLPRREAGQRGLNARDRIVPPIP